MPQTQIFKRKEKKKGEEEINQIIFSRTWLSLFFRFFNVFFPNPPFLEKWKTVIAWFLSPLSIGGDGRKTHSCNLHQKYSWRGGGVQRARGFGCMFFYSSDGIWIFVTPVFSDRPELDKYAAILSSSIPISSLFLFKPDFPSFKKQFLSI